MTPACKQCGASVDPERAVYATPVCFSCLPPPSPLPVRPTRYQQRCAEHGLRLGDEVIQITRACDGGKTHSTLYRYSTAASHEESWLTNRGRAFTKEWVRWDGLTEVDLDNGD